MTPAPPFVPPEPIDGDTTLPSSEDRERIAIDDHAAQRARVKTVWMFDRIAAAD